MEKVGSLPHAIITYKQSHVYNTCNFYSGTALPLVFEL